MNIQKSIQKISGIYRIVNKTNGKYYIGSSDNITGVSGRWMEHINRLKANQHDNSYLQRAWNKYGETDFEFIIIEEVPKHELLIVEQRYLEQAKSEHHKQCYNLSFHASGGGFVGHKHTQKSKRQMSQKLKGRVVSDETRQKLSNSLVGRKGGFVGKCHDDKWKKNQREKMRISWRRRKGLPIF